MRFLCFDGHDTYTHLESGFSHGIAIIPDQSLIGMLVVMYI
jgi:hypothetical protein